MLTACGGSSTSTTRSPTTYSVGGTLSGMSGTIVLQNNGTDTLTLTNDGAFAFSTTLAPNSAYSVTVVTQPIDQTCSVSDGSGTLSASIDDVAVICTWNTAVTEQWTWYAGSDYVAAPGVYGTQGTAAAGDTPGARREPSSWTDANGNFWLFGGYGTGVSAGTVGMLDDLWEYTPSAGQWVWQGGADSTGAPASYGSQNTPAAGNTPGAREGAAHWVDASGNLWLFGGDSLSGQSSEQFNDLWEYVAADAQWVWVGGSNVAGNAGSYGSLGVAAPDNLPPARTGAISWVDKSGVFWLFGGAQLNPNGSLAGALDDLWSYSTTTGMWTWVGGSSALNAAGMYGSQGTAAAGNVPAARAGGTVWVDANGNFWLFGGLGLSQSGISQQYNDLWEYSPGSGEWTWVGGSDAPDDAGIYGTQGSSAAGDGPGARASAVSWEDTTGNLWLFGGYGYDALGDAGNLNDLWEYNIDTGLWTWVGGSSNTGISGSYGTQGTSSAGNVPGARQQAVGWRDASGNFWLFGGFGFDAFGEQQNLNDLWSYTPNS
ncbi:MAG TPA: kelch repeat-containing protein [Steroidobacteraceae bacterium]|nr:kelch repeat-containing protein [Steroidobacteraceae bacterium]